MLWAVSVGLLLGSVTLFGLWMRGIRDDSASGSVRISRSWERDAGVDLAGLRGFVTTGTPGMNRQHRRASARSLGYTPPTSAEITVDVPAPF